MLQTNEYGNKCRKCKKWVNPFCGYQVVRNDYVFHTSCLDDNIEKLLDYFMNVMGLINEPKEKS